MHRPGCRDAPQQPCALQQFGYDPEALARLIRGLTA